MTDEQIINIFKYCNESDCNDCYNCTARQNGKCTVPDLGIQVSEVIERQRAEIERLNIEFQSTRSAANSYKMHYETAKSEAIKEFAEKVDKLLKRYSHIHEDAEIAMQDEIECDNETIEMQSVWDVHTLIRYEMGSGPEEMNRLQDNIETIAKERLLKEIEKDLRLLVKEMTEVKENEKQ